MEQKYKVVVETKKRHLWVIWKEETDWLQGIKNMMVWNSLVLEGGDEITVPRKWESRKVTVRTVWEEGSERQRDMFRSTFTESLHPHISLHTLGWGLVEGHSVSSVMCTQQCCGNNYTTGSLQRKRGRVLNVRIKEAYLYSCTKEELTLLCMKVKS